MLFFFMMLTGTTFLFQLTDFISVLLWATPWFLFICELVDSLIIYHSPLQLSIQYN